MVDVYKPSVCVAFYSDNAENRGTNHAAEYARSKDVPVRMVREPYVPKAPTPANAAPTPTTEDVDLAVAAFAQQPLTNLSF
jgi:hypothetical protein